MHAALRSLVSLLLPPLLGSHILLFVDDLKRKDMDIQTLTNLFATTYDPNPNTRKAGELDIRKVRTLERQQM